MTYKEYEDYRTAMFEFFGSGCCNQELWKEDGSNCPKCEHFDYCGEGQDMVRESAVSAGGE